MRDPLQVELLQLNRARKTCAWFSGDDIIRSSTSGSTIDLYPPEKIKCGVAFLYMMFGEFWSVFIDYSQVM